MSYLETARRSLAVLRSAPPDSPRVGGPDPEAAEPKDRVGAMSLEEFAQAGLVVQVRSNVLGQDVLFVSDDVPEARIQGLELPIYRVAELRKLALCRPRPSSLRRIHEMKAIFQGDLTDVQRRDQDD